MILQVENVYSLLYGLRIYVGSGPARNYVPEKPSVSEVPLSERFLRVVSFFRPVELENTLPMEKLFFFADFLNLVFYFIYRIIYLVFYIFIAVFCFFVKGALRFRVFFLMVKRVFLKLFLRLHRTTLFSFLKATSKAGFNFCYCVFSVVGLRTLLLHLVAEVF